jgi:hypothetical protein
MNQVPSLGASRSQSPVTASTSAQSRQNGQPPTALATDVGVVRQADERLGMPSGSVQRPSPPDTPSVVRRANAGGLESLARRGNISLVTLRTYLRRANEGGLESLARRENISLVTLRTYLRGDGTLTRRGENPLNLRGNGNIPNAS